MLKRVNGDIFQSTAEAIVNPVNCVGVSGAGLAFAFKINYPENYDIYRRECQRKNVKIGEVLATYINDRWIINLPTKIHWKDDSQYSYIIKGLEALEEVVQELELLSVAIPRIGCGKGNLDWERVFSLIETMANRNPSVTFYVYG